MLKWTKQIIFATLQYMKTYTYRIIIEPDENATFHAYVPALRGCHTWGSSIDEARTNVKDALDVYVRSLIADGEDVPQDLGIEAFESISLPIPVRAYA